MPLKGVPQRAGLALLVTLGRRLVTSRVEVLAVLPIKLYAHICIWLRIREDDLALCLIHVIGFRMHQGWLMDEVHNGVPRPASVSWNGA